MAMTVQYFRVSLPDFLCVFFFALFASLQFGFDRDWFFQRAIWSRMASTLGEQHGND